MADGLHVELQGVVYHDNCCGGLAGEHFVYANVNTISVIGIRNSSFITTILASV